MCIIFLNSFLNKDDLDECMDSYFYQEYGYEKVSVWFSCFSYKPLDLTVL